MRVGAVSAVVAAGEEPAAVLGVDEVALGGAGVVLPGHRVDLGGAVAGRGLAGPHAHLPAVVEDEPVGAAVLEDGVVVLVLVELDAAVEPGGEGGKGRGRGRQVER